MVEKLPARLEDLKLWLSEQIPVDGSRTAKQTLLERPLSMLVWHYLNWVDRLIPPRPRKTNLWADIMRHSTQEVDLEQLVSLSALSERGADLLPYLSDKVTKCGFSGISTKRARGVVWDDKDLALNAYGVHHLHFTPLSKSGRRKGDSNKLLFAMVSREALTPIMVGDHKSFDDGSLFTAVAAVRLEMGMMLPGVSPPDEVDGFTLKENARLARAGIVTFASMDEHVVPAAMLTQAGTSLEHQSHATRVMRHLHGWEEILEDPSRTREAFIKANLPETPQWRWRFDYGDLILEEEISRSRAYVLHWKR